MTDHAPTPATSTPDEPLYVVFGTGMDAHRFASERGIDPARVFPASSAERRMHRWRDRIVIVETGNPVVSGPQRIRIERLARAAAAKHGFEIERVKA